MVKYIFEDLIFLHDGYVRKKFYKLYKIRFRYGYPGVRVLSPTNYFRNRVQLCFSDYNYTRQNAVPTTGFQNNRGSSNLRRPL
jgi:hypothetical protein